MRSLICNLCTISRVGDTIAKIKHLITKLGVAFIASGFGDCSIAIFTFTTTVESIISPLPTFFAFIMRFSGVVASFESSRAHVMQAFKCSRDREKRQKSNNK